MNTSAPEYSNGIWLSYFSKIVCGGTLFLIFVGSLVTSTGSGLSVPDWPLSYGTLFPPMVGGVFYEHSHRMVASVLGFSMLCLAIWLAKVEKRRWVKNLGFVALGVVICQGILGGITVLFFLPKPVSILHGILAQTFFILTIIIAYSQSKERFHRQINDPTTVTAGFLRALLTIFVLIYFQLIFGAVMRHTGSGLAIPDFPTMGGELWPRFDERMLVNINWWRFEANLPSVTLPQVVVHFWHRLWAGLILIWAGILTYRSWCYSGHESRVSKTIFILDAILLVQIGLGIVTVFSQKFYMITSWHVTTGALTLGYSAFLLLRFSPLSLRKFRQLILNLK